MSSLWLRRDETGLRGAPCGDAKGAQLLVEPLCRADHSQVAVGLGQRRAVVRCAVRVGEVPARCGRRGGGEVREGHVGEVVRGPGKGQWKGSGRSMKGQWRAGTGPGKGQWKGSGRSMKGQWRAGNIKERRWQGKERRWKVKWKVQERRQKVGTGPGCTAPWPSRHLRDGRDQKGDPAAV